MADQRPAMPPYQQIAADLRARIESGELAPGDMLPSITRLSREYDVAKGTAVKALDVLRRGPDAHRRRVGNPSSPSAGKEDVWETKRKE